MDNLFVSIQVVVTLWTCPVNALPTDVNTTCTYTQAIQTSKAPERITTPPVVTPAKEPQLTYTLTGQDTTRVCGFPPNTRNKTGCYDEYTPANERTFSPVTNYRQ